jgi:hypothetical protein
MAQFGLAAVALQGLQAFVDVFALWQLDVELATVAMTFGMAWRKTWVGSRRSAACAFYAQFWVHTHVLTFGPPAGLTHNS